MSKPLYDPPVISAGMDQREMLLRFAESVANCRSAQMHGIHGDIIEAARQVVLACGAGDKLRAIGRYQAGSAKWTPFPPYGQPDPIKKKVATAVDNLVKEEPNV